MIDWCSTKAKIQMRYKKCVSYVVTCLLLNAKTVYYN